MSGGARTAGFVALFAALTALGIWWAAPSAALAGQAWAHFAGLPARTHALLALLAIGLIAAEMLRFWAFGRALGIAIRPLAALEATIAGNFFSWITPGASLGEPAATYVLGRHGVPWDAAVLIAYGKFMTSFVFILGLGCALLLAGLGPPVTALIVVPLATAVGLGVVFAAVLVVGAFWPGRAMAAVDWLAGRLAGAPSSRRRWVTVCAAVARRAIERLARFRALGAPGAALLLASHVGYYGAFVAVIVVLADAFGAPSMVEVAGLAVIYQGFLYLVPTPGAAGIGEASAGAFFGALLGAPGAFGVVVLARACTFYLHVVLGLVYMPMRGLWAVASTEEAPERRADEQAMERERAEQGRSSDEQHLDGPGDRQA